MIYGYCRVSTPTQSIDRQKRNILKDYPAAKLYMESYTGTKIDRPQFDRLLAKVRAGDTIVFDSVSRMSRNADDGTALYMELYGKGIELIFLKEQHISTATYRKALDSSVPLTGTTADYILEGVNKYLMALAAEQIKLAFVQAEKEVTDLQQRTKEGLQTARLNGKQIGGVVGKTLTVKKAIDAKPQILQHSKDFGGTLTDAELIKLTKVSRNTFYKYKRELKNG